ncbi:MAG: hypothetical protein IPF92_30530 [Myxococcales bacterium]|nr:hypothetical protein [Myxococcales bacterium]MBL0196939.1 hypothetical protein [Myxococcales bacterium]
MSSRDSSRDPLDVLRERAAKLEAELAELEARRREQPGLSTEAARVERDLVASRTLLERVAPGHKPRLPMLDAVSIASPCSARWEGMVGDDRARFCGKCEKNVYNLSALTRDEAEAVLRAKEGELCVRLYRREDGTVLTQDCPVGVRRKRMRVVGALALGGSFAGALASFAYALTATADEAPPPCQVEVLPMELPTDPPPAPTPTDIVAPNAPPPGKWVMGGRGPTEPPPPPHVKMGRIARPATQKP